MKLTCDICNGDLEIVPGGIGAICKSCGLTYSVKRLKEKLESQPKAKPDEDIIYDVVYYRGVEPLSEDPIFCLLVGRYGKNAVEDCVMIDSNPDTLVDYLVSVDGCPPIAIFVVTRANSNQGYQHAVNAGKLWEQKGAYSIIFFEEDCDNSARILGWVRAAMEKASRR